MLLHPPEELYMEFFFTSFLRYFQKQSRGNNTFFKKDSKYLQALLLGILRKSEKMGQKSKNKVRNKTPQNPPQIQPTIMQFIAANEKLVAVIFPYHLTGEEPLRKHTQHDHAFLIKTMKYCHVPIISWSVIYIAI